MDDFLEVQDINSTLGVDHLSVPFADSRGV